MILNKKEREMLDKFGCLIFKVVDGSLVITFSDWETKDLKEIINQKHEKSRNCFVWRTRGKIISKYK